MNEIKIRCIKRGDGSERNGWVYFKVNINDPPDEAAMQRFFSYHKKRWKGRLAERGQIKDVLINDV